MSFSQAIVTGRRNHKYNAKKITIDGHTFPSLKEAERYGELKLLEKAHEIRRLELQPQFVLQESFMHQGKRCRSIVYVADFSYWENGEHVIEDAKGFRTKEYKLKKKMFLRRYGNIYEFRET